MSPSWFERLSGGMGRTREQLGSRIAALVGRGPVLDAGFWDGLEESLIGADMGAVAVGATKTSPVPATRTCEDTRVMCFS